MNLKEKFLVLKDIQDFIDEPAVKTLLQLMAQRKLYDRDYNTTVIIVPVVFREGAARFGEICVLL